MKLTSCNGCGVLFDADKIKFPKDWRGDEGVDHTKGDYNQNTKTYSAFVKCPVCGEQIFEDEV